MMQRLARANLAGDCVIACARHRQHNARERGATTRAGGEQGDSRAI